LAGACRVAIMSSLSPRIANELRSAMLFLDLRFDTGCTGQRVRDLAARASIFRIPRQAEKATLRAVKSRGRGAPSETFEQCR